MELQQVVDKFAFRANDYYLNLIDWTDPEDPIRKIIIPDINELNNWGDLDPSNEASNTMARGVQHKYRHTVLLLCNEVCGGYCRYCFRKRLFLDFSHETSLDISEGLNYIRENPQVTNVLLTGGDPLVMSTKRIETILSQLREIPHVKIIRIGSKMPAFDPWRILDDERLQEVLSWFSEEDKRIYLMAHFDHPRELTLEALAGIETFLRCGVICCNQNPMLRGINDDPEVLGELFRQLSWIGCPPYYVFQGRPASGNEPYEVPIVEGFRIFQKALKMTSGLGRRARFVMSHSTGKIEILAIDDDYIYMRYHRARDPKKEGLFFKCYRNDAAYWLDQLRPVDHEEAGFFYVGLQ